MSATNPLPTSTPSTNTTGFSFEFDKWNEVVIRLNWVVILLGIALIWLIVFLVKHLMKKRTGRTITIEGMSIGIGNLNCTLTCSHEVQEIAYQLWVELTTRKIAIPLDDNDVILEVYDSWYAAFTEIRKLLKTVSGKCLVDASDLIDITTKVLNEGLRPHLTKWHARYRAWYTQESKESNEPPQSIQMRYPQFDELLSDMRMTNERIINFANKLHEIAFGNKERPEKRKIAGEKDKR